MTKDRLSISFYSHHTYWPIVSLLFHLLLTQDSSRYTYLSAWHAQLSFLEWPYLLLWCLVITGWQKFS